jgi:hypothetical protein
LPYHPDDFDLSDILFRELTKEEENEFFQYARDNDPPNIANWEIYHPACRKIWRERGICPTTTKHHNGCLAEMRGEAK